MTNKVYHDGIYTHVCVGFMPVKSKVYDEMVEFCRKQIGELWSTNRHAALVGWNWFAQNDEFVFAHEEDATIFLMRFSEYIK